MKTLIKNLQKLRSLERKKHHKLQHKIHRKHKISKKTLFYIKEYGPHSHVTRTIIRESFKILLLTSLISSFGGFALEHIKLIFISIFPLIILLPALNDMIGDYSTIVSSKFSTMLHEGKIRKNLRGNKELKKLFIQILIISLITTLISAAASLIISKFSNYKISLLLASKIFIIAILDVLALVIILFFVSVYAGLYFYKKNEDPNNFLIPITTSTADFGNMLLLAVLVILLF